MRPVGVIWQSESAATEPDLFAPRFAEILCAAEGGNREPHWWFLVVAMRVSRGLVWLT